MDKLPFSKAVLEVLMVYFLKDNLIVSIKIGSTSLLVQ